MDLHIFVDDKAGTVAQVRALRTALEEIWPTLHSKETLIPRGWWERTSFYRTFKKAWSPPSPDSLVILAGRGSTPLLPFLKQYAFTVVLQHPKKYLDLADVYLIPTHDAPPEKSSILPICGALGETRLLPHVAQKGGGTLILIGGPNKAFSLPLNWAKKFRKQIEQLPGQKRLTCSRRTPPKIRSLLEQEFPDLVVWKGENPNPYRQWLQEADAVLCTQDSVSMLSEVATLGKPLYVERLPSNPFRFSPSKFEAFLQTLVTQGHARLFEGSADPFSLPPPLQETVRSAKFIQEKWESRHNEK